MENTCTHELYPEFGIWTQFVSNTLTDALELDALKNSHPIEVEVGHPSEVDEIFDAISYNKVIICVCWFFFLEMAFGMNLAQKILNSKL